MKAAIFTPGIGEHGVQVQIVPAPSSHSQHELLIKVRAAGLNPSNFKVNMGRIPFYRHLSIPVVGYDVEGQVLSSGNSEECKKFQQGDSVYGFASGSIAEYALVGCARAAHSPKSLTPVQTAGLPVVALTSLEAWDRSGLQHGQSALVIGASGGCGIFGVTLGKAMGASISGICSTRNVKFVQKLGATKVYDYKNELSMANLIAGGQQFDVIYDTVTSFAPEDPNYEASMRPLLKTNGKYIAINGARSDWMKGMFEMFVTKPFFNLSIQRKNYDLFLLKPTTKKLERLTEFLDSGKVPPTVIDTSFILTDENLNTAFMQMKSRRTVGKICFEL